MPFAVVRQDITKMKVDAIVNAANQNLVLGSGVCGAIFRAAGLDPMQEACNALSPIKTGRAVATSGFNLPVRYVIHAVGPVYNHWSPEQSKRLLRSAYIESLNLAYRYQCKSIAFPLISSGHYGYPKKEAFQVAMEAIRDFLHDYDMDVYLTVFDQETFAIGEELMGAMETYIDEKYVDMHYIYHSDLLREDSKTLYAAMEAQVGRNISKGAPNALDKWMEWRDETFSETLIRLIDAKGLTDTAVYQRAYIDRKLFSKIRKPGYKTSKKTILSLAVALELTLDETDELLRRAGYALAPNDKTDCIVSDFIVKGNYEIYEINDCLAQNNLPTLGEK